MIVTVRYWIGAAQHEGKATTYKGAMRLASKNRNAYSPSFCDDKGVELFDDGIGLAYPDSETVLAESGAVIERRQYAV